ncbi:MAG: hypothetical protein AWM53_01048 [Candidatus Dichloromethanomonas elyunquensis]|nr:MAG: hypothetical protein AWM53_01048 [Candidatus Dichloromethanomonas elyunquensis]
MQFGKNTTTVSAHKFIHMKRVKINLRNESYQQYPQGIVHNLGKI